MPKALSLAGLSARIQQLVAERHRRADALAVVDLALEEIRSALGAISSASQVRSAPVAAATAISTGVAAPASKAKKRRKRGKFATTGSEAILALVKEKGKPTVHEIYQLWASQGRGGRADQLLHRMVKDGQLKRTPIAGQRGSRYSMA